jgi:hypothetical protein
MPSRPRVSLGLSTEPLSRRVLTTNDKPRHVHVARVAVHFGLEGLHSLDRGIVPAEVVNVCHGYVELAHGRSAGIQRSGGNITRNFWGGGANSPEVTSAI